MEHIVQFFQNHWQLSVAFIVISGLIFVNEYISMQKQAKNISPEKAVDLINNNQAVVLDLRDATKFKEGHIIGSMRVAENEFETPRLSKYKDKDIILVCTKGIQAANVAKNLLSKQFTKPLVLSGGIDAWRQASLPLTKK